MLKRREAGNRQLYLVAHHMMISIVKEQDGERDRDCVYWAWRLDTSV